MRLERQHHTIGLIAQDQDRTGMRGIQCVPSAALVYSSRYVRKCCGVTGVSTPPSQRILIGRISAALPAFSASGHAQPIAVKPGRA